MSEKKKLSNLKKDEMSTNAVKGGNSIRKHDVLSTAVGQNSSGAGKAKISTLNQNIGVDDSMSNSEDGNYYPPKH